MKRRPGQDASGGPREHLRIYHDLGWSIRDVRIPPMTRAQALKIIAYAAACACIAAHFWGCSP